MKSVYKCLLIVEESTGNKFSLLDDSYSGNMSFNAFLIIFTLKVFDFAEEDEVQEGKDLWTSQIHALMKHLGS